MFDKGNYTYRRDRLMREIGDGLIILPGNRELPYNYSGNALPFRQDSTFLYYIGVDEPGLWAVMDCDSREVVLFGNDVSIDDIIWTGPMPLLSQKASEVGISRTMPLSALEGYVSDTLRGRRLHYIYPYQAEVVMDMCRIAGLPASELRDGQSTELILSTVNMRKTKTDAELAEIEASVNITAEMHLSAMRMVGEAIGNHSAITERDVVGELYKVAAGKGYYHSFAPIVTVHGEVFHNHGYGNQLRKGQLLLIDAGAEGISHYAGDMTRTIPVGGHFSSRQKDVYDIVHRANMGIIQSARPGVLWRDMHDTAARIIVSGLKDLGLMRGDTDGIVESGAYALFFPHGLGHLMGLDVHDMEALGEDYVGYDSQIRRSDVFGPCHLRYALGLQKNMVITDEPGIYFAPELIDLWRKDRRHAGYIDYDKVEGYKGFGGIRIEDDIQITDRGCRVMGVPVPKEARDVEDFVSRWAR